MDTYMELMMRKKLSEIDLNGVFIMGCHKAILMEKILNFKYSEIYKIQFENGLIKEYYIQLDNPEVIYLGQGKRIIKIELN